MFWCEHCVWIIYLRADHIWKRYENNKYVYTIWTIWISQYTLKQHLSGFHRFPLNPSHQPIAFEYIFMFYFICMCIYVYIFICVLYREERLWLHILYDDVWVRFSLCTFQCECNCRTHTRATRERYILYIIFTWYFAFLRQNTEDLLSVILRFKHKTDMRV